MKKWTSYSTLVYMISRNMWPYPIYLKKQHWCRSFFIDIVFEQTQQNKQNEKMKIYYFALKQHTFYVNPIAFQIIIILLIATFALLCTKNITLFIRLYNPRTFPLVWMHLLMTTLHQTFHGNRKSAATNQEWYMCMQVAKQHSHVGGNFPPQNAHIMTFIEWTPYSSSNCSSKFKPISRERRGLGLTRKPPFPCSIALMCASNAHDCCSKFSKCSFICLTFLSIVVDFPKSSMYSTSPSATLSSNVSHTFFCTSTFF